MHELQQILLQKLPRLSKLIFGGRIRLVMEEPLSHNHILEALGEDWAMTGERKLIRCRGEVGKCLHYTRQNIQLPQNLSDLSLPEHKETCERLISLLK